MNPLNRRDFVKKSAATAATLTVLGTAVRAASEDMEATSIQGINSTWVYAISFALGIGLTGVAGVQRADILGGRTFAMRIWLKPDRMAALGITAGDVLNAIREQNVQAPAGQVGQLPAPKTQQFQYSVQVQGRL